jgi:hypothetical protein
MSEEEYEPKINPPPKPSTPRLAPWDHVELLCTKLDRLIAIMEAQTPTTIEVQEGVAKPAIIRYPGLEPVTDKLEEIKDKIEEMMGGPIPWVAKDAVQIFRQEIRTADTFYGDNLVDWRRVKRGLFFIVSSLNQSVSIQLIGNLNNAKDNATDVGTAKTCPANDSIDIIPDYDDWHPYIGVKIVTATAPTSGSLFIWGVVQE